MAATPCSTPRHLLQDERDKAMVSQIPGVLGEGICNPDGHEISMLSRDTCGNDAGRGTPLAPMPSEPDRLPGCGTHLAPTLSEPDRLPIMTSAAIETFDEDGSTSEKVVTSNGTNSTMDMKASNETIKTMDMKAQGEPDKGDGNVSLCFASRFDFRLKYDIVAEFDL